MNPGWHDAPQVIFFSFKFDALELFLPLLQEYSMITTFRPISVKGSEISRRFSKTNDWIFLDLSDSKTTLRARTWAQTYKSVYPAIQDSFDYMQPDQELFILLFANSGITEKLIHSMEQELSQELKDKTRILEGFIILCVIEVNICLMHDVINVFNYVILFKKSP